MPDLDSSSNITRDYSHDYFFGAPNTIYLVTEVDSMFPLENGKRYFADFDISGIPYDTRMVIPFDSLKFHFMNELKSMGHAISNVKVEMVTQEIQRITFTVTNPALVFWVILALGAAIGLAYGLGSAGAGFAAIFIGLGEATASLGGAVERLAEMPEAVIKDAIKNPIAVIALVIVIGIFIIGVK